MDFKFRLRCIIEAKRKYENKQSPSRSEAADQPLLSGKPIVKNVPLRLLRRPLDIKFTKQLRYQFAHFHQTNVLSNACSRSVAKLDVLISHCSDTMPACSDVMYLQSSSVDPFVQWFPH